MINVQRQKTTTTTTTNTNYEEEKNWKEFEKFFFDKLNNTRDDVEHDVEEENYRHSTLLMANFKPNSSTYCPFFTKKGLKENRNRKAAYNQHYYHLHSTKLDYTSRKDETEEDRNNIISIPAVRRPTTNVVKLKDRKVKKTTTTAQYNNIEYPLVNDDNNNIKISSYLVLPTTISSNYTDDDENDVTTSKTTTRRINSIVDEEPTARKRRPTKTTTITRKRRSSEEEDDDETTRYNHYHYNNEVTETLNTKQQQQHQQQKSAVIRRTIKKNATILTSRNNEEEEEELYRSANKMRRQRVNDSGLLVDQQQRRVVNKQRGNNPNLYHKRLSSSFKEEDEEPQHQQQQQQQQRRGGVSSGGGTFITRNLIRMFKSSSSTHRRHRGRSHSSFSDDDDQPNHHHNNVMLVKNSASSSSADKLSKKFLNMILTARTSSSSKKCSKSAASDDLKIALPKTHSFRPIQISIRRRRSSSHVNNENSSSHVSSSSQSSSLGFTVVGYCPCQVGKVEKNSIAENSGLLAGDLIIKINGKNVSRATCDSIVKLIKTQTHKLKIEILRPIMTTTTTIRRERNDEIDDDDEDEEESYSSSSAAEKMNDDDSDAIEQKRATQSLTTSQQHHRNYAAQIATTSSNVAVSTVSSINHHYHGTSCGHPNSTENYKLQRPLNYTIDEEEIVAAAAAATTTTVSRVGSMPSPIPYLPPLTDSDYRTQSSSSCSNHSSENAAAVVVGGGENEEAHMNACEALLDIEERFIELMQRGVQQYSRPLRHCAMISTHEHEQLFQNIEKILAISEYQLNQLISRDASVLVDMFATIGRLYENKMRMSCEAFDLYLNGVRKSFDLFASLTNGLSSKLARFLADSQSDAHMLSLATFLLLPLHYVTQIHASLVDIRRHTSTSSQDYATLSSLIARLECYVEKSRPLLAGQTNPLANEDLEEEGEDEEEEEEDLIDDDNDEYSSDVMDRDHNHNNKYTVSGPNQLIYSSSLYYRQSCHRWKKIRSLFFADRCIMLDANVSMRRFMEALLLNDQQQLDRFKHKTIYFTQIARVSFSQNQQRYRNEFVVVYSRRNNNSNNNNNMDSDSSPSRHQAALKLKCTSREEMLWWSRLFETYVKRRR